MVGRRRSCTSSVSFSFNSVRACRSHQRVVPRGIRSCDGPEPDLHLPSHANFDVTRRLSLDSPASLETRTRRPRPRIQHFASRNVKCRALDTKSRSCHQQTRILKASLPKAAQPPVEMPFYSQGLRICVTIIGPRRTLFLQWPDVCKCARELRNCNCQSDLGVTYDKAFDFLAVSAGFVDAAVGSG